MTQVSIVIATRDRHAELLRTLGAIGALPVGRDAEVIVVDNASAERVRAGARLANGVRVRTLRLDENAGAAGRNAGAEAAEAEWLLMLDDDSAPTDAGFLAAADGAGEGVGAVGGRIDLTDGTRERGGLPEVIVGCGALVRRGDFLDAGGYDASFGYYAEEYDLCARLLLSGLSVSYDQRLRVVHRKVNVGRDMGAILRRITRNSAWVELRYAPERLRDEMVEHVVGRYGAIAEKEGATAGFERGVEELAATYEAQPRREMDAALYDRFTGLAHARASVFGARERLAGRRVAMVGAGKQAWAVERALAELSVVGAGCELVGSPGLAEVLVVGTLSPGPMFDALAAHAGRGKPVVAPWSPGLPALDKATAA
ncbi:MAG: glycosyltransferase [Planctomycetota bacterium]